MSEEHAIELESLLQNDNKELSEVGINVFDGQGVLRFDTEHELAEYLAAYPEAENDRATSSTSCRSVTCSC
jgi:hypothetical protein